MSMDYLNYYFLQVVERSIVVSTDKNKISEFLNEYKTQVETRNGSLLELDCLIGVDEIRVKLKCCPQHHIEFAINSYVKYIDSTFHDEIESWFDNYVVVTKNPHPTKWNDPDFLRWVLDKKIGNHKLKSLVLLLPHSISNGYLVIKYPEEVFHCVTLGNIIYALSEINLSMRILFVMNKFDARHTILNRGLRFAENVKYITLD